MVFVFGIDIPLVELIFVLTLVLVVIFGVLIYIIVIQNKLHKELKTVLREESMEIRTLKDINKENKIEMNLLRSMRQELDQLIYNEAYSNTLETLMKIKGKRALKLKEKEKIKRMANSFWKEVISTCRKNKGYLRK